MSDPTTTMPPDAAHALALITQGLDLLAATDLTRCPDTDLITVAKTTEQTLSRLTYHGDRQWMELSVRGIPRKHGHTSMHAFAGNELHASDITRRMRQVRNTQTPPTITGEPVTPECPTLAAAFAAGHVGPSHITVVLDFVKALPVALPHDVKVAAEQTITELATQYPVDQVKDLAAELMARLDPDGSLIDKPDRHRRRGLWLGKQGIDGMSKLTGTIDPVLRAHLETLFAAWGQPGVNNPDDESSPAGDARATEVIAPALKHPRFRATSLVGYLLVVTPA
ncbi:DUF222 domain-containing protein [Gordonia sp. NB41Y]|uniref:DUF222 domain-containing protein n=1 Tax=Gordonia sp. NB41Y TaxID=875808 RepID=UPI0009EBFD5F|nr:DUF222 domain-containing protein [Gordonia sp. NB41Y]WLP91508.1 DUF222 domain-containing protein [Gordonia sp. NB41Y]